MRQSQGVHEVPHPPMRNHRASLTCADHLLNRLVPDIVYPEGADDVQMMREWIYSKISAHDYGHGSVDKVILPGHSAGGAHVAMDLYAAGIRINPIGTKEHLTH